MKIVQVSLVISYLALAGCGSTEILVPGESTAPEGVDFSGTWVLREKDSADERSIRQAIIRTDGGKQSKSKRRSTTGRGKHVGLVDVFLETGRSLKITQTPHGFFVSVDRSVVEEFRFGEHRTVSVGGITGQRVSGWVGPVYVVETLDMNGMKLTERFSVSDDKQELQREITFRSRRNEEVTVVQRFDKTKPGNRAKKTATGTD